MFSSQTTNIAYTILIEISQYFNIFTNITAELFSDDFCKSKLNLLLYQIISLTSPLTFSPATLLSLKILIKNW